MENCGGLFKINDKINAKTVNVLKWRSVDLFVLQVMRSDVTSESNGSSGHSDDSESPLLPTVVIQKSDNKDKVRRTSASSCVSEAYNRENNSLNMSGGAASTSDKDDTMHEYDIIIHQSLTWIQLKDL